MNEPEVPWALCGRAFPPKRLTKHHCRPREKGGTRDHVELICSPCHGRGAATYKTEVVGRLSPTIEQLRKAGERGGYVKWVRKQPATRRPGNAPRRRKR